MSFAQTINVIAVIVNALFPSVIAILVAWFLIRARHSRIALVIGLVLNALLLVVAYWAFFNFDFASALACFYGCGEWTGTSVFQLELGLNLGSILVAVFALTVKPTPK